ncbi:MAG TPA: HAMP domain-containing sensor histidine kinase [bacterium]|nr:HAMP domain-containing sensor histidine kinase [bacterium]HPN31173.1 HAMP domain-containing sensor histidine kinase [bacterium]
MIFNSALIFYLVFKELKERKKLETELQKINESLAIANEELKTLDELKNNIISNVSHELRTPLVAVRGYSEILKSGKTGYLNENQQKQLNIILRNVEKLVEIIENLLSAARYHSGVEKFEMTVCDVRMIVKEAFELGKQNSVGKNIAFNLKIPDFIILIKADKLKIFRALKIIIDNAVKFIGDKGLIAVSVESSEESGTAKIRVKDNGIGINRKDIGKVFDKFFQCDLSTKKKFGGAGIGLTICKEIICRHNGEIKIESLIGEGTEFIVSLPLFKS